MSSIKIEIVSMELLGGGDTVCVHMNDGSTEVLPIDNIKVKEYLAQND